MTVDWPPVIVGAVITTFSVVILRARTWIARTIANLQRATFGPLGEPIAKRSTPNGLIAPSILGIAIGVVMITGGIFGSH